MEAIQCVRVVLGSLFLVAIPVLSAQAQQRPMMAHAPAVVRSENFIIHASDPTWANEVAQSAERQRHDLAIHWLGKPLPKWPHPCPIVVLAAPNFGASGSTSYEFAPGTVKNWRMNVKGSRERILDSVLPHEITHTILASHFAAYGKPVPRWADEGACTTVEHESERRKHDHFLVEFLANGRGLPFATMFTLKDYPPDIMPLYAQGYSVVSFLVAQGGPRRFVQFLEDGLKTEDWATATETHYGYAKIGKLQSAWNRWVSDGGGKTDQHTALALGLTRTQLASNVAPLPSSVEPPTTVAASFVGVSTPAALPASSNTVVLAGTSTASQMTRPTAAAPMSWYREQFEKNKNQSPTAVTVEGTPVPSELSLSTQPSADYSVGHPQPVERLGSVPAVLWSPASGNTLIR